MDKKPFSVMFSPIPQQRLDGLTLSPPVVSHQHRKPSDEFLRAVDQDIADFTINIIAKPLTMAFGHLQHHSIFYTKNSATLFITLYLDI
ncbi:hypothetical protein IGI04_003505 [Brassica rapa subsp. trilocularis]|uniref:Uncharacterized protein n=1 Tax=Brassica rapa subsp. trilocularis TaxID=1813537 RepID=A0ABQ7NYK7_BRACM|nr:hypothetical protein IGI04_003505 [Brassica rapa subsp. trilocularis]